MSVNAKDGQEMADAYAKGQRKIAGWLSRTLNQKRSK